MTDDLERDLRGLDRERPLSAALYAQLESALLDDAETRRTGRDDIAAALGALDASRPVPASTRAALESALVRTRWGDLRSRVLLGAAAAVIVVVGAFALLRGGSTPSHHEVAVGTAPTSSSPRVSPEAQAPATTGGATPSAQGQLARPYTSPSVAKRSTTATTWDCGLCARNGYTGSATSPTTSATFRPANGPPGQPAAAMLAAQTGIGKVDPSSGPHHGGTVVTLTGSGFTGANGVRFGAAPAVNFTVVSDGEIRVQTPPSPTPQRVTVTVTYADGSSTATSDDGPYFTYT